MFRSKKRRFDHIPAINYNPMASKPKKHTKKKIAAVSAGSALLALVVSARKDQST